MVGFFDGIGNTVDEITTDQGDPGWGPDDTEAALDGLAGSTDEWVSRNPVTDGAIDLVWEGHEGDSIDVLGPGLWGSDGSVTDVLVDVDGESHAGETTTTLFLWGGLALVVLYLVRPLLTVAADIVAGVVDDE
ncbi:hypothetical protein E4P24_02035 [Haloferax sp. AS1]|uniref:Uncharacterized protein n=1 Tax=Haloferax volcanii TaxID=2246 RepID=A0A558G7C6_HALVO|nr:MULTISPECIES: hypothetical protein [Haloferax]MBC9985152.1 hypothetical protein [Haloferax sp. AS1]TVT93671.1 hypothetical protein FQA18_16025 [Haloferax volcanii]